MKGQSKTFLYHALTEPSLAHYAMWLQEYHPEECVVLCRIREQFGDLLNMSSRYHMVVNDEVIRSVEALYQLCRFPHPDHHYIQRRLIKTPSPFAAKRGIELDKPDGRKDWYQVKVLIMRWCLHVKLACNYEAISTLLIGTGSKQIVETSPDGDFWGGTYKNSGDKKVLVGVNMFGQLLMELRQNILEKDKSELLIVRPLTISDFLLFGHPIQAVDGNNAQQILDDLQKASVPVSEVNQLSLF